MNEPRNGEIIAYTDGSSNYKSGLGGFGVYLIDGGQETFLHKGYSNTKIGRMELMAMITCLRSVQNKRRGLTIYSDSMYVVNCINKRWLFLWERRNWTGIKNQDLVKLYLEEYRKFLRPPIVKHVKGHTNEENIHSLGNEIADKLASYRNFKEFEIDKILD